MDIHAAVAEQRGLASTLFDQLRRDGLDEPGVTRDPYGAGEQRAHATITAAAQRLGLRIEHDAAANLYMTFPGTRSSGEARRGWFASRFGAAWRQFRRRGGRRGGARRGRGAAKPRRHAVMRSDYHGHSRRREHLVSGIVYRQSRGARHAAGWRARCAADRYRPHARRAHRRLRRRPGRIARAERASSIPRACAPISNCTSNRRRVSWRLAGRSRSAPASPAISAIRMRASKAATTMSACHGGSVATRRWPAPSSPWHSIAFGKSMMRAASRWHAPSAASTPIPPPTG